MVGQSIPTFRDVSTKEVVFKELCVLFIKFLYIIKKALDVVGTTSSENIFLEEALSTSTEAS